MRAHLVRTTEVLELGEGPAVMLLHAGGVQPSTWQPVMERLAAEGHRAVAPAFPGYGRSAPAPALDLEAERAQLEPVLERLEGPVALVGHSYGGEVAWRLAARHARVDRLILIEPPLIGVVVETDDAGAHAGLRAVEASLQRGVSEAWLAGFVDSLSGPGFYAALPEARRQELLLARDRLYREVRAICLDRTPSHVLARLAQPVLMLHGTRTPPLYSAAAKLLSSRLRGWRRVPIAGAGHFAPLTHPGEVARLILEELRR